MGRPQVVRDVVHRLRCQPPQSGRLHLEERSSGRLERRDPLGRREPVRRVVRADRQEVGVAEVGTDRLGCRGLGTHGCTIVAAATTGPTAGRPCHTASVTTASRKGARVRPAPTLEEVAARAGVSRATASRVLRGDAKVSERAREVVLAAAREISYVPNLAARTLVTGRSESVAFLVEETEERMFADPFFLGMLRSAQEAVAVAGLQLVFTVMTRPEDQERFLAYAAGGHVDGVLLLSLHGRDQLPQRLEALGVPTVLSGRPLSGGRRLWYVDSDNVGGGELATNHLLDSGREHVATVAGPLDMCAGQDRLAGYRSAIEATGRPYDESLV